MWAHTLILSLLAVPDRNTSLKISYWRLSSDLVSFLSFVHRCKARAELSYVHLPRLSASQALNELNPIPEKGSLASFASPPGLYSRLTIFGCISLLCLCLILILASYFNYLTPLPLLLRRFQSTQSQLVTRKDWWSSPRAWSQWIRVNWPYYKSTYLRKLLTKPKKGQLQLCCRFPSPESFHTLGWESLQGIGKNSFTHLFIHWWFPYLLRWLGRIFFSFRQRGFDVVQEFRLYVEGGGRSRKTCLDGPIECG